MSCFKTKSRFIAYEMRVRKGQIEEQRLLNEHWSRQGRRQLGHGTFWTNDNTKWLPRLWHGHFIQKIKANLSWIPGYSRIRNHGIFSSTCGWFFFVKTKQFPKFFDFFGIFPNFSSNQSRLSKTIHKYLKSVPWLQIVEYPLHPWKICLDLERNGHV